jgi:hypothetical protein
MSQQGREFWGPKIWHLFHVFAQNTVLNGDTVVLWQQFFRSTLSVMNCDRCKKHFSDALGQINIGKMNDRDLQIWLFNQHNTVNKSLSRPLFMLESLPIYDLPQDEGRTAELEKIQKIIEVLTEKFMVYEQSRQIQALTGRAWNALALRFMAKL